MSTKLLVRNGIVRMLDVLGFSALYRYRTRRHGPLTRIIVFHDVPEQACFRSLMETLTTHTNVLTPESFVRGDRDVHRCNILVTFDDGYQSWIDYALPVLEEYGIRALFFVNSGLLDAAPVQEKAEHFMCERLRIRPRAPLTWEGAATLLKHGHTIGGHARMHEDFGTLSPLALMDTIQSDRVRITEMLGVDPLHFAYPFGTRAYVTRAAVDAVRAAGYTHGYTAESGWVLPGETFTIPRMCIEDDMTPQRLMHWLGGGYDLFGYMREQARHISSR